MRKLFNGETIPGRKLYEEIRYVNILSIFNICCFVNWIVAAENKEGNHLGKFSTYFHKSIFFFFEYLLTVMERIHLVLVFVRLKHFVSKLNSIFFFLFRYADISNAPTGHITYVRKRFVALFLCVFHFWNYWCTIMVWITTAEMLHSHFNYSRN